MEMPHRWTNVISHSSSQQYLDENQLNGVTAGGIGRKEGRQACCFSGARPQQSKVVLFREVGNLRSFLAFITSGIPTQFVKLIWSKHKVWVKFSERSFSYAVVFFGDTPAESVARVVGHDQTI